MREQTVKHPVSANFTSLCAWKSAFLMGPCSRHWTQRIKRVPPRPTDNSFSLLFRLPFVCSPSSQITIDTVFAGGCSRDWMRAKWIEDRIWVINRMFDVAGYLFSEPEVFHLKSFQWHEESVVANRWSYRWSFRAFVCRHACPQSGREAVINDI